MGTSLWLVATTSFSTELLRRLIEDISKAHSSPAFFPHVTLANLPDCTSIEELVECLDSQDQLTLTFNDVKQGSTYFQSVFIDIQQSKELLELHELVHKVLGVQAKTPNFPHMSLYYGEDREEVFDNLCEDPDMLRRLVDIDAVAVAGVHELLATEAWIVHCEGKPEDWIVSERIGLGEHSPMTTFTNEHQGTDSSSP